jgi:hypothetical protein
VEDEMKFDTPIEPSPPEGNEGLTPRCLVGNDGKEAKSEAAAPEVSAPAGEESSLLKAIEYWVRSRS